MLCAGILPVNQMRDYIEPAYVISSRVPMHLLEAAYGMKIRRLLDFKDAPDRPPTPHEMLEAYCALKGYITNGTGRWDEFRACKELLRDFNDGRILFVSPPTGLLDMARWLSETEKVMIRREKVAERVASQRLKELLEADQEEQRLKASGSKVKAVAERGEMVFGNSAKGEEFQFYDDDSTSSEDEDGDEDDDDASLSGATPSLSRLSVAGSVTQEVAAAREHKRLKRWGKKNKKLRTKTPCKYKLFNLIYFVVD
jgi:large subunit GTPase 1